MVNLVDKKCSCGKLPNFGLPNSKIPTCCKNCKTDKDAVRKFLASYVIIPEIVKFIHRKKMQFIDLQYRFEGEPETRRIICEIEFTICYKYG